LEIDARIESVPAGWHNDRLHFFKYMTASTAKIVLENRTLRWSTASLLNDPFDMQFDMTIDIDRDKFQKAVMEKTWGLYASDQPIPAANELGIMMELLRRSPEKLSKEEFYEEFGAATFEGYDRMLAAIPKTNEDARPHIETNKVLSLTTAPNNNLMWTHYADGHSGVVLRFRSIPELDSPYGMAKPMNYVDEVPHLFSEEELVDIAAGISNIDVRAILDKIIYTKSSDYSYEREWRISTGSGRTADPFEDIPFGLNELDGIVFGLNTSDVDRAEIEALAAKYPNVEFMHTARAKLGLEIKSSLT